MLSKLPSILIIADHRFNRSPSQRYRFEQYLDFFKSQGFNCELSEIINEEDDKIFYHSGKYLQKAMVLAKSIVIRIKDLQRVKNFDLVFIQREALFVGSSFFEKQFFKKSKVVFDFDDSIWLLDTSPENKKFEFLKNPLKTKINIQHAHAVIAGNAYLASYAKLFNRNVYVVPTTIDTDFHKPVYDSSRFDHNKSDKKIVIGWSGSITTIKHFEIAIPALTAIKNKYGDKVQIHVIGQGYYEHPELHIISKSWSVQTEVNDICEFDIGIMPLPEDEWVKGKCGLKGLSYMACGVATIMSNVGVNPEIIEHEKNGLLADTTENWINALSILIDNDELRKKLGEEGRKTVVEKYSVEANKRKYLEILKSLIK